MLLAQFPDAAPQDTFNNEEIKQIFYHSMPVQWCTNFINSGQVLRTYMVQQELQTNAHGKRQETPTKGVRILQSQRYIQNPPSTRRPRVRKEIARPIAYPEIQPNVTRS